MGVRQRPSGRAGDPDLQDPLDPPGPVAAPIRLWPAVLPAAVLALGAIGLLWDIDAGDILRPALPTGPRPVVRRRWGHAGDRGATAGAAPAVFNVGSTPAARWACRNWSLGWLAARLPAVQAKLRPPGSDPVFWYYAERQWMADDPAFTARFPTVPVHPEHDEQILAAAAFFGQLGHNGSRLYAAGPVEDVLPPRLLPDIGNASAFFSGGGSGGGNGGNGGEQVIMNVWMGSAQTTAAMHYDTSGNFFIPLQGRKRFTLLPPPAQSLGLFPAHHPYYRHLRPAAVASVLAGDGTMQHTAGLREVVVGPGDVLYIPPYWFHQVETLDPGGALALNLWSPSAAFVLMERAFVMPVPFESNWDDATMRRAIREYLTLVGTASDVGPASAAASPSSSGLAAFRDLEPRWAEFIANDNAKSPITCGTGDGAGHNPFGPKFGARAMALAALFRDVDDEDVRSIHLCNFAEQLIANVLGIAAAPSFIAHCVIAGPA